MGGRRSFRVASDGLPVTYRPRCTGLDEVVSCLVLPSAGGEGRRGFSQTHGGAKQRTPWWTRIQYVPAGKTTSRNPAVNLFSASA